MIQRIDAELERVRKAGQTPRRIEVGSDLYEELHEELNPGLIAAMVGPSDKAPVHTDKEVREYQDIPVFHELNEKRDYLNIVI